MSNNNHTNSPSTQVESPFNIIVSLGKYTLANKYIENQITNFCKCKGIATNSLAKEDLITDIEFTNQPNLVKDYIYPKIMDGIKKSRNGSVEFTPKIVVTLDESLCPNDDIPGFKYGRIKLGDAPILYYLWIDIQEIIKHIKP